MPLSQRSDKVHPEDRPACGLVVFWAPVGAALAIVKRKIFVVLKASAFVYVGLCAALYFLQDSFIYYPQERAVLSEKSTMHLRTEDADIVVTTSIRPGKKAIIYFGGNAEDVSLNLSDFERVFPDYSLYFMHYRGYGGSTGNPSEEKIYGDVVALYELVKQRHEEVSLVGRSLGTGLAVRLASERPISRLVLVTPYNSIEELAKERYPFFPVSLLLHETYRSWLYAKNVKVPTTILMAERDEVVPNDNTIKLYSNFQPGIATIVLIHGVGHNSISANERYYWELKQAM